MMRHLSIISIAAASLVLAGCSTPAQPEPAEIPKSDTQQQSEAIPKSERGNIVKTVGELAELKNEEGELLASFTVNSITVNPECTSELAEFTGSEAANGFLVGLDVTIETTPAYETGSILWGPWGWKAIDSAGVTFNDVPLAIASCYPPEEELAGEVGPGEKRVGKILLDVPSDSGVLVFNNMWEWKYPAA